MTAVAKQPRKKRHHCAPHTWEVLCGTRVFRFINGREVYLAQCTCGRSLEIPRERA